MRSRSDFQASWFNYNQFEDDDNAVVAQRGFEGEKFSKSLPVLQVPEADPSWREDALCKVIGKDHDFFNMGKINVALSKRLCNEECTVREQCLNFALDNEEMYFIWGGTTPDERKVMLRQRKVSA